MNLKFLKRKKNYGRKNLDLHQDFYWKLIVTLAFVFTAVFFVFGYYTATQVGKEDPAAQDSSGRPLVEKEKLAKALDYFTVRQNASREITSGPAGVVDPSQ